ncbi:LOW QUALITY PROTEIN: adhesion G protein-coupled receptor L2-like [Macrobrachium nipponense]|uniref:LOW QUALITY PROTEIN: adhesion G protein-coupled receptor L2-like n=1 Tax=Macrobrachium nipponense TaxID=159736 RepID=UPI0030C81270
MRRRGAATPLGAVFPLLNLLLNCAAFTRAGLELNDAIKLGSVTQVANILLAEGAPVSTRDNIGWTPLHNAANTGGADVAKLLISHKADLDARDMDYGLTALHLAAKNGEEEVTEVLLEAGASSNLTDIRGQTPLHLAAWKGHLNTTLLLLEHGADINARDDFGSTPLRLAAIQNSETIVKALLTLCPDLRLPDNKGVTVEEFAKKKRLVNIVSILEDHRRIPCSRHKLRQGAVEQYHLIHNAERCPRGDREFPDEHLSYHWKLKETSPGRATEIPCPTGTSGTAAWVCGRDGKWLRTPDLSKCHSLFFSGWQEVMATENITAAEIVTEVATSLQDAEKGISLATGDLLTIGERMAKLQDKHRQDLERMTSGIEAWKLAMKYLKGVMDLADVMLSKPALVGLSHEFKYVAFTQLQDSVKFATITLASQQLGSFQEFAVKGLITRVMNRPLKYYKSVLLTFDHPGHNETLFALPFNFYETYSGDPNALRVTYVAFNDLHCTLNAVPCNPDEVVPERDLPALGQVNTPIVGATIGDGSTWSAPLDEMVVIKFQHMYAGDKFVLGSRTCAWWDVVSHAWATDGCYLVESNDHSSVCHCEHLTNIAVVMDIHGIVDNRGAMYRVMRCVTIVGCVVAIVSLALCIVCFLAFKDVRERCTSIILANLCFCILLSEMVLLGGVGATDSITSCTVVAGLLHYLFLATFIWNAIDAFHMYIKSKIFRMRTSPLKYYLIAGYLVPALYIVFTFAFARVKGYSNDKVCWLTTQALIWSFTGPLAAILLFNVLVFLMAMYSSWCKESPQSIESNYKRSNSSYSTSTKSTKSRDSAKEEVGFWGNLSREREQQRQQQQQPGGNSGKKTPPHSNGSNLAFHQQSSAGGKTSRKSSSHGSAEEVSGDPLGRKIGESVGVLVLLCLTWLCGFLYYLDGSHVVALIFTCLNSMQGVSIFVLQIVMNPTIMQEVRSVLK